MNKTRVIVAFWVVALAIFGLFHFSQEAGAQSGSRTVRQAPYHDTLWSWLRRNDYRKWNGPEGGPPAFQEGQSPHGALIKTYVNWQAARDLKNLADGSVIVKENYSPDKKLMAITVMQRFKGYDPRHGDWYYAKFMPSGKIARTPPEMKSMPVAGKFPMCVECHNGAGGDDFVFFNDGATRQ